MAIAHKVPSSSEMTVESPAIWTEVRIEGQSPRVFDSLSYQRQDHSGGGRLNTAEFPKLTATVIHHVLIPIQFFLFKKTFS
mgnify:CR=1 FL=1